jgi:nucleotide-binding universal stress UspA family protein
MKTGEFCTVLVPVEFETSTAADAAADEVVRRTEAGTTMIGPYTVEALKLAARLARGGEVWLVHVRHDASEHATWMSAKTMTTLRAKAHARVTDMLQIAAKRHCSAVESRYFVESGDPVDAILRVAKEHAPDAIVLAASSRGRINRAFHGSTADKLIRRAPCPVVVLPSGTT